MTISWKVYCDWQATVPLELIKACALRERVKKPYQAHHTHILTPVPTAPLDHLLGFLHRYRKAQSACISNKYHLLATNWPIILCFHFFTFKSVRLAETYLSNMQRCLDFSTLDEKVSCFTRHRPTEQGGEGLGQGMSATLKAATSAFLLLSFVPGAFQYVWKAILLPLHDLFAFLFKLIFLAFKLAKKKWQFLWQNRAPVFRNIHYAASIEGGRILFRQLHCFPL